MHTQNDPPPGIEPVERKSSAIEISAAGAIGGGAGVGLDGAARDSATERGLRTRKSWWLAAGVLFALAAAGVVTMRVTRASKPLVPLADRHNIPLVSTFVPGIRPVNAEVMVTGSISARHDLPIGDGGQAERIVAVYVQVGDVVKRGQILARLDDSVLQPQVAELAASLAKARAQAALAAAEYRRAVAIGPDGGLSAQNVEQLQAAAAMDAANTRMVAAQLQQKRAELALTRIIAPVAGTVLTRAAEIGQVASPGGPPLFTLEAENRVELIGQVAEQDLVSLQIGQPARVYLIGYPRPFPGHIWLLGATVDTLSRLGEVRIALAPNPALRPGTFARAVISESHSERPVVPQTAVMTDSKGSYVFIVNRRNIVVRRPVQLGGVLASGVVIAKGLTGQERVVTLAGGFLQSGEKVRVARAGPARS